MTPPKIYIRKDPCTGVLAESWQEEPHVKYDTVFYSEEAIREAAIDMLNTGWADSDFDKAIEFMIELLKGDKNG